MSTSHHTSAGRFRREPPPFTVSRTRRMHPLWRYLWPYRSANHFAMTMCFYIAMWTIQRIVFLPPSPAYDFTPLGLLVLVFIATVMIPYDELPAKVTITTQVPALRFLDDIREEMADNRYAVQQSEYDDPGHVHFRPQGKAEFWPLIWIEQDVDVWLRDDNTIDVYGSKVDLSKLVHNLKRRYKRSRTALA